MPQALAEFQERLAKTQLFDAVRVQLMPETLDPDGTNPVQVSVTESFFDMGGNSLSATRVRSRSPPAPARCRSRRSASSPPPSGSARAGPRR